MTHNFSACTGHSGPITAISFSENGYYLATAADDACVKLWDLRKLKNFKTIQLDDNFEIKDLCFDQSGTYLALAGTDVRYVLISSHLSALLIIVNVLVFLMFLILFFFLFDSVYLCKQWQELKVFNDHTAMATGVRFGRNAQYIASTSMDRTLKIYAL